MSAGQEFERDVTRTIGAVYLRRPDLIDRVSHDELRRMAAEEVMKGRRRMEIPAAFRDAFAGDR